MADTVSIDSVAQDQLRAFIERIERMEEEKKAIADDIREIYAEASGNGFDVKVLRLIIRIRKQDHAERMEQEALLDLYMSALGMRAAPREDAYEPRGRGVPVERERASAPLEMRAEVVSEIPQSLPVAPQPAQTESDRRSGDADGQPFLAKASEGKADTAGQSPAPSDGDVSRSSREDDIPAPIQESDATETSIIDGGAEDAGGARPDDAPQTNQPVTANDEGAAATETAPDYLREPPAVVSGQITGEGDAPLEAGTHVTGEALTGEHFGTELPETATRRVDDLGSVQDQQSAPLAVSPRVQHNNSDPRCLDKPKCGEFSNFAFCMKCRKAWNERQQAAEAA